MTGWVIWRSKALGRSGCHTLYPTKHTPLKTLALQTKGMGKGDCCCSSLSLPPCALPCCGPQAVWMGKVSPPEEA